MIGASERVIDGGYEWGGGLLPALIDFLGIGKLIKDPVAKARLVFKTGNDPSLYLSYESGEVLHLVIDSYGIEQVKNALGVSHLSQEVTITIPADGYVYATYQYAPTSDELDRVLALLDGKEVHEHANPERIL